MTTIDLECPKCGAPGSAPKDKIHSRLVCKKCHTVFHLTPSGRAVPGEPPDPEAKKDHPPHHHPAPSKKEAEPSGFPGFTRGPLLAVLALALMALGAVSLPALRALVAGPSEIVTPRAEAVAKALAGSSADAFKQSVLPGTEDDATRFYEQTMRSLAPVREKSPSKEVEAKVLVLEVDADQKVAQVVTFFTPKKGSTHVQQVTEVAADDSAKSIADVTLWFSKDGKGSWRLDGRRCVGVKPAS